MSEATLNFAVQTHRVQFVVPSEMIKKNIKLIQKQIEKSKKQAMDEIARIKGSSHLSPEKKLAVVKRLIKTYEQLHKKLSAAIERDQDYRSRLSHRARRLNELAQFTVARRDENSSTSAASTGEDEVLDFHNEGLISWYRDETNLLIVDYLLKSNTRRESNLGLELLHKLDSESTVPLSKLIDHDVYTSYNRVFVSISEDHDLEPISAWYNENRAVLKKISSNLLFEIHYCKYLSLIEHGDPLEAIAYSKKNLAPYAKKENYSAADTAAYDHNVGRLMKLGSPLVCISLSNAPMSSLQNPPQSRGSMIAALLSQSTTPQSPALNQYCVSSSEEHWSRLSECFTKDYTKVYGIPQVYPLFVYLSAGLSALKTKSCFCNRQNTVFDVVNSESNLDYLDSTSSRDLSLRGPNHYYKILKKINQCPVCSPELYALSRNLPYAQLITSIYNNPFKLPNGNIYPFDKLLNPEGKLERDNLVRNGQIRDPLTREIFFIDNCVRVYPA
ncbi:hypothetical protein JCM33374_g1490 [Metschnikowia sp. JCM 33374]|nr:hypothetical protein JCM33374_g1490 [Metschnikowia sp. JCM 33374]